MSCGNRDCGFGGPEPAGAGEGCNGKKRFELEMEQGKQDPYGNKWNVLVLRDVDEKRKASWKEFVWQR